MTTETDTQNATHDGEFEDVNPPTDAWIRAKYDEIPYEWGLERSIAWIIEQDQRRRAGCP